MVTITFNERKLEHFAPTTDTVVSSAAVVLISAD
jgi:hypothetical protein